MILVTTGTNEARFDRLISSLDSIPGHEEIIAQTGASAVRPARAKCVDFLPFDELSSLVQQARVVVMHAGIGSILLALSHGKRPIVVTRSKKHGEAVDDHQMPVALRFADAGLVTLLQDLEQLPSAVNNPLALESTLRAGGPSKLSLDLRLYLEKLLGPA